VGEVVSWRPAHLAGEFPVPREREIPTGAFTRVVGGLSVGQQLCVRLRRRVEWSGVERLDVSVLVGEIGSEMTCEGGRGKGEVSDATARWGLTFWHAPVHYQMSLKGSSSDAGRERKGASKLLGG
jgi:hypothetical protein